MRKFTEIPDSPAVAAILSRLHDEGIDADISRGESMLSIYGGGFQPVSLWVSDDADDALVRSIIRDCSKRLHAASCPACGYDLRGHVGEVSCPECGAEVYAGEVDVTCEACGEVNPGSFETCWHCDKPLPDAPAHAAAAGNARQPLPPGVEEVTPDRGSDPNAAPPSRFTRNVLIVILIIIGLVLLADFIGGLRLPLPW